MKIYICPSARYVILNTNNLLAGSITDVKGEWNGEELKSKTIDFIGDEDDNESEE